MQLYHKIKLNLGYQLLKQHKLEFIDIWYYDYKLHKECILTFTFRHNISHCHTYQHWKRELLKGVSHKKYRITYVHFGKTMLY